MDRYRYVVNSVFEDGIVNIMRVRLVLMFTKHVADGDRERNEDYWSEFYHIFMSLSLTWLVTLKTIRAQKTNRQTLARWTIFTFICTVQIRFCLTSTTTREISRLIYREGSSSTDNENAVCHYQSYTPTMSRQKKRLTWFWIQFSTLKLDAKNWVVYRYSQETTHLDLLVLKSTDYIVCYIWDDDGLYRDIRFQTKTIDTDKYRLRTNVFPEDTIVYVPKRFIRGIEGETNESWVDWLKIKVIIYSYYIPLPNSRGKLCWRPLLNLSWKRCVKLHTTYWKAPLYYRLQKKTLKKYKKILTLLGKMKSTRREKLKALQSASTLNIAGASLWTWWFWFLTKSTRIWHPGRLQRNWKERDTTWQRKEI